MSIPVVNSLNATLKNNRDVLTFQSTELLNRLINSQMDECYELIYNDRFIKPYFDIDIKRNCVPDTFDELNTNRQALLNTHLDFLRQSFDTPTFAISSCHRDDKISFHIIINNYKTKMEDMYNYSRTFKNHFDCAVYNSTNTAHPRKFRTILSKKGDSPLLMPETLKQEDQLEHHFINNVCDNYREFNFSKVKEDIIYKEAIPKKTSNGLSLGDVMENSEAIDYKEWLKIGISMLVVLPEKEAREEFLKFSMKHSSFRQNEFDHIWRDLLQRQYKRGGWNNLKKYIPIIYRKEFIKITPLPIDITDYDASCFIKDTFDEFSIATFYADSSKHTNKQWYIYKNHKWNKSDEITIRSAVIEKHLYKKYEEYISFIQGKISCSTDEERDRLEDTLKTLRKTLKKIKQSRVSIGMMDHIFSRYYIPDFKEKLDQNPFLLGFDNGVYDFKEKCFRDGIEEDFVSLSTGYDYNPKYDTTRMENIKKIISDICCNREDLYKILLTTIAHALIGDNCTNAQLFYCWYGGGSNGKSTIANLLKNTLGKYFTTMPTTFLTQKTQRADGCNAEIANMVGRRFVVCSETEENTPINISTLKNFTGEETISYRGLYESIRTTNITWSLWLLTNDKVKIPSDDYGTLRRFKYMPFDAKFVNDPSKHKDSGDTKHYKADKTLISSLSEYKNEFFNLLLPYVNEPLVFPNWQENITNEMIKSQDKLGSILDNLFEYTDEERYGLSWLEIKALIRKEKMFHQLSFNSDHHMFEKISKRLDYAVLSTSTYTKTYTSTFDNTDVEKKSKKFFQYIKRKNDDEEMDDECYI